MDVCDGSKVVAEQPEATVQIPSTESS